MKLYNTRTRQVETLHPQQPGNVSVYSCGPTVYDHIHIGNLSAFIYADTLRRTLKAAGLKVQHVMNFTDVDDKTIRRSQAKYSELEPMAALQKLTAEYSELFLQDMKAVGNDVADITFVKATDAIEQMQSLIRELYKNDFAYVADDGVYFSIEAYKKSGKTYGQLTEITASNTSAARIDNDEYDKDSVHDFALWKRQKANEPAWEFELDGHKIAGRPGWHIECSAMSVGQLGQPFDIHTAGVDLIFPHNENEIAQSTAGQDIDYANMFMHNEHLLVDGQKMSKSLHNFYTLQDIVGKGFDPLAFRLLVLQAHYRSQAHFSWDNLQAAQNRLQDLRAMAALRWQPRSVSHDDTTFAFEEIPQQLKALLQTDLNTAAALALLSQVSTQLQVVHIEQNMVEHLKHMLKGIDELFGLRLLSVPDISSAQKKLIEEREAARQSKDWAKADALRATLQEQGIGVNDAMHGPIWYPL